MQRTYVAGVSAVLMAAGVFISSYAYLSPEAALNPYEAVGSVALWGGAFLLLTALFLSGPFRLAAKYLQTRAGAAVGAAYLTAHLLLYGFLLEWILVEAYKIQPFVLSSVAFVTTDVLYPATLANVLLGDAFSPSISFQFPPIYEASLSLFAIFMAVVIDVLILANVAKVKEIRTGSWMAKSRAYAAMPLAGVVLGASCCMSLPALLGLVSPSLSDAASSSWAFYVAYFAFPPLAVVVLKLNLDLASRIGAAVRETPAPVPVG
ncbi:MAG: hypothetical protein JRN73_10020 [Nitrososphaerota archaeon]|nr:hypothetical protein [Nitrososphaerota archaeon]